MSPPDAHMATVDGQGYFLEHSADCLLAGTGECPMMRLLLVAVREGHIGQGRRQIWLDEAGVLLWDL